MNLFRLLRLVRRAFLMQAVDGEGGGAPAGTTVAAPVDAGAAAPAAPAVPAIPSAAEPAAPAAPKTMAEAMSRALEPKAPAAIPGEGGQPRDVQGRFAPKTEAEKAAAAAAATLPGGQAPAVKPAADPTKPAAPEDLTKMPEGLTAPAQQRFQQLANTNRELTTKVEQLDGQVAFIRDTFQSHGVQKEQFEQAVGVIGMINRGEYEAAGRILQQQLQQIAIMTGKPVGAVDALADFPDLRQAVDGMQVTEQHALELARGRVQQQRLADNTQRQQQTDQAQQQTRQATEKGIKDVDAWCAQMAAADVDFVAIEAQLLPEIPNLIKGLPPASWTQVISTQYRLMKQAAAAARTSGAAAGASNVLRPTGSASPAAVPKSMHEAMWGQPARA